MNTLKTTGQNRLNIVNGWGGQPGGSRRTGGAATEQTGEDNLQSSYEPSTPDAPSTSYTSPPDTRTTPDAPGKPRNSPEDDEGSPA